MRQDESIALSQQQGLPPRRPPSWALRNAAWMAVSVTLLVAGALALVLHGDGTSPGGALRQSLQAQQMWMFAGATLLVMACFAAARTDLRRPARAMQELAGGLIVFHQKLLSVAGVPRSLGIVGLGGGHSRHMHG